MAKLEKTDKRTHYCGELRRADAGKAVCVMGWVQRARDLGGLIFIDLRDRTGIVQLAFDEHTDRKIFDEAFRTRSEYVVVAKGAVRERSSVNSQIPTGEIEIFVTEYKILSKYRYLDLRRPSLQKNLIMRHKIARVAREYYYENGFLEIETPMMVNPTPEGARDYLVPSRIHHGSFYALPQSPQQYKQLLMLAGFDRYIQLARCFRD